MEAVLFELTNLSLVFVLHNRIEIAHEFASAINSDEIIRMILFGSGT